jgi:hypothetical protein
VWGGGSGEVVQKSLRKLSWAIDTCVTLIIVTVSQVYAYVKTYQNKYVNFTAYQLCLTKAVKKKASLERLPQCSK